VAVALVTSPPIRPSPQANGGIARSLTAQPLEGSARPPAPASGAALVERPERPVEPLEILALDAARPRALALTGGVIAVLGYAARAALSLIPVFPDFDMAVVATIPPMVLGVGLLGIATVRGKRLSGWQAWTPLLTVAAALVTAAAFSIEENLNFILLGLLWGPAWLLVGGVVFRHASSRAQRAEAPAPGLTAMP